MSSPSHSNQSTDPETSSSQNAEPILRYRSRDLFGSGNRIRIEHEGKRYTLHITRLRKLILTA